MVTLSKIYTRGGDAGMTSLGSGERRRKDDLRIETYGTVDEANSFIGVARAALTPDQAALGAMLAGQMGLGLHRSLESLHSLRRDEVIYQPARNDAGVQVAYRGWQRAMRQVLGAADGPQAGP